LAAMPSGIVPWAVFPAVNVPSDWKVDSGC
jgi:hypothetical protein